MHRLEIIQAEAKGIAMQPSDKRLEMKKQLIDLEYQAESIKTRVRDIEWLIEVGEEDGDASFSDRRKALDKLKFINREITELKIRLLEE